MRIFKTIPKYLVPAASPLFGRVNPSFVRKLVSMCITDLICAFLVHADVFQAKKAHQARTRCTGTVDGSFMNYAGNKQLQVSSHPKKFLTTITTE